MVDAAGNTAWDLDNYYTSVGLAEYLLGKKTYVCGTIRKNRKHLSKEVVVAKLKKKEMKCQENYSGIKLYNWRDKRNVFMISTVPEHDGSLVPSGKTNRNGEELKKPQCVLDYNNAKKGVDVSDQMTSYHTALRRSLKWHRKVAIEIMTGMSIVNAHVLYNKYFADAPMSIRHFHESLALCYWYCGEEYSTRKILYSNPG
ncbi:PiggyBac transposable element-derived protein [Trinorchestia longiramus]|nr:PiggyBac transposable element-derived protein [Trinorchestia longiramus]